MENWTYGFEELKEAGGGIPGGKSRGDYLDTQREDYPGGPAVRRGYPGCIQIGSSLERQANCGQTLRAIICLMGICGNIERPGSMVSWVLPATGLIEDFFNEIPITDEMKVAYLRRR